MTNESVAEQEHAELAFLQQLERWQMENSGQPVTRTSAEWQRATGLDENTLTRVRKSLRDRGSIRVEPVMAWSFSSKEAEPCS